MKGLQPYLDTRTPEEQLPIVAPSDDFLGSTLQKRWERWQLIRRQVEERWLEDLRMFNQENDPEVQSLSKFHSHIYTGTGRKNVIAAISRIYDVIKDKHWQIQPTPVPESEAQTIQGQTYIEEMEARAEMMSTEIEDQLVDLRYDDHLLNVAQEMALFGTGVMKGIIPTVKKAEKWAFGGGEWDVLTAETPWMQLKQVSVWNVYPDPYALDYDDISGVFERHVLNRQQFSELKDDGRFKAEVIDEILLMTEDGNHTPLWHETQRRNIAKITDTTAAQASRYDVLEYWGQVSGRMLSGSGIDNIEDKETYYANVWVCNGKTLLAKLMPMKKKRVPYHFAHYARVPQQFWGVGPIRLGRSTTLMENGIYRATLDGLAMAAVPMSEININMLRDGESPELIPGKKFLRDSGDPATPAVRFFQPDVPTQSLLSFSREVRTLNQEETLLPAYSYGSESESINDKTMGGTQMRLNMASLPSRLVVKNLEDGVIKPIIEGMYDWNMQWSDKEEIKGDMNIVVLGSNDIMIKEQRSQSLMTALNVTANPLDAPKVDRKYLLRELFKSLGVDEEKAVPDMQPEENQQQPDPLTMAKVALTQAQTDKTQAEAVNKRIESQYSGVQSAQAIATMPGIVPIADSLMQSAGYVDANGAPIAQAPGAAIEAPARRVEHLNINYQPNTDPRFPANPVSPAVGLNQGIETLENDA